MRGGERDMHVCTNGRKEEEEERKEWGGWRENAIFLLASNVSIFTCQKYAIFILASNVSTDIRSN